MGVISSAGGGERGDSVGLEFRLNEIVGEGKNVAVSFGIENKKPLVEIVLKDGRLVEVPVNP